MTLPLIDPGVRARLRLRFGEMSEGWFERLPSLVDSLASRWALEVGGPIPRGSVSVVLRCRTRDGTDAILKVSPDRARIAFEAAALAEWVGGRAPAVLALDAAAGALLLEAVRPGTPLDLAAVVPSTTSVAGLMSSLHRPARSDDTYPTVAARAEDLFEASTRLYDRARTLEAVVPRALYERGWRLAEGLAGDSPLCVLLHGDLTPANVLDGGPDRGLVAIDPAPCLGDPAFDAVDLLLWRADDPVSLDDRIAALARAARLDAGRLRAWCVAFAGMTALELADGRRGTPAQRQTLLDLAAGAPG